MAFQYHGFWGGPGWSDGRYTAPGERLNPNGAVTDIVDEQFRTHDLAYDAAEKAYAASTKTALDRTLYWAAIIVADNAVKDALLPMVINQSLDPALAIVAAAAIDAFTAKDLAYNYPAYMNASDPAGFDALQPGLPGVSIEPYRLFDPSVVNPRTLLPNTTLSTLQSLFQQAEATRSPLVLDLDGDGVETLGLASGIHFDHDGNGFAELSGWVGKDDGLLVLDKDGSGSIDNGGELFGNNTLLSTGAKAANGFAALSDIDTNADGKVNASDAAFANLRVWRDANSDAVAQTGELLTLATAGVQSLSLNNTTSSTVDANGNAHKQIGTYTGLDGSSRAMDDVWFTLDTARTVDKNIVAVSSAIAALPDIAGFGNVRSLHQAMARDASGNLQALVAQFAAATDSTARSAVAVNLIYAWAGVSNIDPASRASSMIYGNAVGDARKLASLEAFLGESYMGVWCWGALDPNPHAPAATVLLTAFDQLTTYVTSQLLAQTVFKPFYDSIGLILDSSTGQAGSFILAQNSFIRSFIPVAVSDAAKAVPNIGGAGWVRDLQEAATQSPELIALLNQAKEAPTRAGYKDAVASLMRAWGNDSAYNSAPILKTHNMINQLDAANAASWRSVA